ncbi:MAG: hypothetical protein F6J95_024325 [Leptolyngbya sp. SIO1E4]|nr:hypothetical protein [Leptolyngbya sp. SIO1E4]
MIAIFLNQLWQFLHLEDRKHQALLGNLAVAYQFLAQPETAIHYAQKHLAIALEIGDRAGEVCARLGLTNPF